MLPKIGVCSLALGKLTIHVEFLDAFVDILLGFSLGLALPSPVSFSRMLQIGSCADDSEANAAPMLVTEIAYPKYRAPLTSLYNSMWYSGNVVYVLSAHFVACTPLTRLQCDMVHFRYSAHHE